MKFGDNFLFPKQVHLFLRDLKQPFAIILNNRCSEIFVENMLDWD